MSQTSIVTAIAFGRKKSMASSSDTHSGSLKRKRQLLPLGAPPSENVLSRLIAINIQLIQYYRLLRYQLQSSGRLFEQIVCLINKNNFWGIKQAYLSGACNTCRRCLCFQRDWSWSTEWKIFRLKMRCDWPDKGNPCMRCKNLCVECVFENIPQTKGPAVGATRWAIYLH